MLILIISSKLDVPVDNQFLQCLQTHNSLAHVDGARGKRIVMGFDGRQDIEMEASDLARIESPTGRLTGFAINAFTAAFLNLCAGYPQLAETANRCAVFSTYDLLRVRYRASDDELWRHTHCTKFWDKHYWLIPIHRIQEEHWVLAVVIIHEQQIFFFDSLGVQGRGWRPDIRVCFAPEFICAKLMFFKDIMVLITRLVVLSNRKQHPLLVSTEEETWIARPLFTVVSIRLVFQSLC
jgi:hypothetical protein